MFIRKQVSDFYFVENQLYGAIIRIMGADDRYLAGCILFTRLAVILMQFPGIVAITRLNKKHLSIDPVFSQGVI